MSADASPVPTRFTARPGTEPTQQAARKGQRAAGSAQVGNVLRCTARLGRRRAGVPLPLRALPLLQLRRGRRGHRLARLAAPRRGLPLARPLQLRLCARARARIATATDPGLLPQCLE